MTPVNSRTSVSWRPNTVSSVERMASSGPSHRCLLCQGDRGPASRSVRHAAGAVRWTPRCGPTADRGRAGARVWRLGSEPDSPWIASTGPRQLHLDGFDLHADPRVAGHDRRRLEQLCRLCGAPHSAATCCGRRWPRSDCGSWLTCPGGAQADVGRRHYAHEGSVAGRGPVCPRRRQRLAAEGMPWIVDGDRS